MPASISSQEERVLLLEKSKELTVTLIPVIMFVSFLMILGMFGNSIVLYYYGRKTKTTPTNCFILVLAVVDLLNCVLCMPMDHADLILYITFDNAPSCKILRFVNYFTSTASELIFFSIAIDRYRRICWPHRNQFSVRQARIISILCVSISALISWPTSVLYDVEHVRVIYTHPRNTTHQVNITGYECTFTTSKPYTPYVIAFHVFSLIIFVAVTVTLGVLYALIGRQLLQLRRYSESLKIYIPRPRINGQSASVTLCPSSSLPNISPTDVTNTHTETDKQGSHKIANPANISEVSREVFVELGADAEYRNPPEEEDRLKKSFSKERMSDLMQYRKDTKVSRNNSVAISNLFQTNSHKIKALRNRRMSWPYQTRRGNPEYSRCTSVNGSDETLGDTLINSTWMPRIEHQKPMSRIEHQKPMSRIEHQKPMSRIEHQKPMSRIEHQKPMSRDVMLDVIIFDQNKTLLPRSRSNGDWRQISVEMHDVSEKRGCHERQTDTSKTQSVPFSRYEKSKAEKRINIDHRSNKAVCPPVRSKFGMIDSRTVKSTSIMFIVTLVSVISFLPYLCLAIWNWFLEEYEVNIFTNEQFVAYNFGFLSYLINSSFNPLIYGLFNSEFRNFLYRTICCRCFQRRF